MTRTIPMQSKQKLPDGPRRDFVEELRRHWRDAGRPPLRKVNRALEAVRGGGDRPSRAALG
jgi:hypothetical protein